MTTHDTRDDLPAFVPLDLLIGALDEPEAEALGRQLFLLATNAPDDLNDSSRVLEHVAHLILDHATTIRVVTNGDLDEELEELTGAAPAPSSSVHEDDGPTADDFAAHPPPSIGDNPEPDLTLEDLIDQADPIAAGFNAAGLRMQADHQTENHPMGMGPVLARIAYLLEVRANQGHPDGHRPR